MVLGILHQFLYWEYYDYWEWVKLLRWFHSWLQVTTWFIYQVCVHGWYLWTLWMSKYIVFQFLNIRLKDILYTLIDIKDIFSIAPFLLKGLQKDSLNACEIFRDVKMIFFKWESPNRHVFYNVPVEHLKKKNCRIMKLEE